MVHEVLFFLPQQKSEFLEQIATIVGGMGIATIKRGRGAHISNPHLMGCAKTYEKKLLRAILPWLLDKILILYTDQNQKSHNY